MFYFVFFNLNFLCFLCLCAGAGDYECNEGKLGVLSSVPSDDSADTFQDASNNGTCQTDGGHSSWIHDSHLNVLNGEHYIGFCHYICQSKF